MFKLSKIKPILLIAATAAFSCLMSVGASNAQWGSGGYSSDYKSNYNTRSQCPDGAYWSSPDNKCVPTSSSAKDSNANAQGEATRPQKSSEPSQPEPSTQPSSSDSQVEQPAGDSTSAPVGWGIANELAAKLAQQNADKNSWSDDPSGVFGGWGNGEDVSENNPSLPSGNDRNTPIGVSMEEFDSLFGQNTDIDITKKRLNDKERKQLENTQKDLEKAQAKLQQCLATKNAVCTDKQAAVDKALQKISDITGEPLDDVTRAYNPQAASGSQQSNSPTASANQGSTGQGSTSDNDAAAKEAAAAQDAAQQALDAATAQYALCASQKSEEECAAAKKAMEDAQNNLTRATENADKLKGLLGGSSGNSGGYGGYGSGEVTGSWTAADFDYSSGADVLDTIIRRAAHIVSGLKPIVYIFAGFGLIAFAWMAIFGKISWKWFANIAIGLFLVANMGLFIEYFVADSGHYNVGQWKSSTSSQSGSPGTLAAGLDRGYYSFGDASGTGREWDNRTDSEDTPEGYDSQQAGANGSSDSNKSVSEKLQEQLLNTRKFCQGTAGSAFGNFTQCMNDVVTNARNAANIVRNTVATAQNLANRGHQVVNTAKYIGQVAKNMGKNGQGVTGIISSIGAIGNGLNSIVNTTTGAVGTIANSVAYTATTATNMGKSTDQQRENNYKFGDTKVGGFLNNASAVAGMVSGMSNTVNSGSQDILYSAGSVTNTVENTSVRDIIGVGSDQTLRDVVRNGSQNNGNNNGSYRDPSSNSGNSGNSGGNYGGAYRDKDGSGSSGSSGSSSSSGSSGSSGTPSTGGSNGNSGGNYGGSYRTSSTPQNTINTPQTSSATVTPASSSPTLTIGQPQAVDSIISAPVVLKTPSGTSSGTPTKAPSSAPASAPTNAPDLAITAATQGDSAPSSATAPASSAPNLSVTDASSEPSGVLTTSDSDAVPTIAPAADLTIPPASAPSADLSVSPSSAPAAAVTASSGGSSNQPSVPSTGAQSPAIENLAVTQPTIGLRSQASGNVSSVDLPAEDTQSAEAASDQPDTPAGEQPTSDTDSEEVRKLMEQMQKAAEDINTYEQLLVEQFKIVDELGSKYMKARSAVDKNNPQEIEDLKKLYDEYKEAKALYDEYKAKLAEAQKSYDEALDRYNKINKEA